MQEPRSQVFFYRALFVLLFFSAGLFVYNFLRAGTQLWQTYSHIYLLLVVIYLWVSFLMLFWNEYKSRFTNVYPKYAGEHITVIVPCFNEHPMLLARAIRSVYYAKGNKDIVIVDDGSTNNIDKVLRQLSKKEGITVRYLLINEGKRAALHMAVKNLTERTDFVVTIDSDTVLHEDALIRVVEPLKQEGIGAASGDVMLLNEKKNMLTRMIGAYYWKSLNIQRKAQSSIGIVGCCSGCLASYRKDLLVGFIDAFANQMFLGERCTYSEDRHLTNLVLKSGHKVVFVPEAICYTFTPSTVKGFLRQQLRWRRGYLRESTYTLTFAWRTQPALFIELLLWDLTLPFLSFAFMLTGIIFIVIHPLFFIQFLLPSWVAYSLLRNFPLVIHAKDKVPGLLLFIGFYEFVLYWQFIYALFTLKNKSWVTR